MTTESNAESISLPLVLVIPTHDRVLLLERTLDSVLACRAPEGRSVRVVVIENGGRYGAEEIVRQKRTWVVPEYHYTAGGNKSLALNQVLQTVPDSLLVFLDDDVRVDPDLLIHYSNAAGHDCEGRFFGGGLLVDYEKTPPEWLRGYLPRSSTGWHPEEYAPLGRMYFFGANWAAFSRDLKKVGGFDQQFGPGGLSGGTGQETVTQQRLSQAGIRPEYIRGAIVWHYVPECRSSPQWALERAYKTAISSGYNLSKAECGKTISGIPLWLFRAMVLAWLRSIKAVLMGNPVDRFHAKFKFTERLGHMRGVRRRHLESRNSTKDEH
ncbi:glycosyltransferase [Ectothiorhodospira lacustris]|uniref:glycosyltransferase n=1 Tax=Ectothiorhodospira lacustris TaxID=2899127 RepID=UPI001EE85990|nr:glycosyltransferase family A protein [Ectothiorhodospira lacustris]MCG5510345.1 glycosyltransferase family 2 protein [Ectothiorhodospira lacustris]MCG5522091.1 glycosyltransferase family 2 protein [Ectothiorhodospira lacustris]